ncbi:retrovirus-related Pol polyprotein from transposon 412 [Trichonephila clavipes]|nr:retrovirus-related Pol polyprotein from transposon 412 [Trichonephila clavipes]
MDYFTKWPEVYPIPGSGSPHRSGGCSAALDIEIWEPTRLGPESSLFLLAYRSAVHETTGYSPSQMLLAGIFVSPCDLPLFGRPPDTPSSPEEYVQNLQARFEDVHNLLENGST